MHEFREVVYVDQVPRDVSCIMGADIGGTNSNFGIFQLIDGVPSLIISLHVKSKTISNFTQVVIELVTLLYQKYGITISKSCFAVAGPVSSDRSQCKPTNLPIIVDSPDIVQNTGMLCAFIANDFEVIGHGLSGINPKDLVMVKPGKIEPEGQKAIIGAGTGLGKAMLYYDLTYHRYMPLASEGGHADFVAYTDLELALAHFIHSTEKLKHPLSWEDVLSGKGIARIYRFFQARNTTVGSNHDLEKGGPPPDEIFKSRTLDAHAASTYMLYSLLYARCAKNYALDTLAKGGLYIAGGIAAHNLPLFEQEAFKDEFINCAKQQKIVQEIPVYVITDYNVSLYGAVNFLLLENFCTN